MPKTGTTTLQADVFPYICSISDYQYLGLFQPHRKIKQTWVMSKLHRWMMYGEGEADLFFELENATKNSPVIISNETILSSNFHSSWKMRILRLERLVKHFDFQVYITIREPVGAMHSYFCEHFLDSPEVHRSSFLEELKHGNLLQIYKYSKSIPYIEDTLKTELVIEAYEEIFANNDSGFLSSLVQDANPFPEDVGQHNLKQRSDGGVVFEKTTLRDTLRRRVYASPLGRNALSRKVIASLSKVTKSLDLVQMQPVKIPALTSQEIALLRVELQAELDFVKARYGIRFPVPALQTTSG